MECSQLVAIYNQKIKNKPDLSDEERIKIIKDLIHPKKYISFKKKQEIILDVLRNVVSISNNKIFYNSCNKYISFINTILSIYTDLNIDETSYDILCSNNLLNYTIGSLASEYDICLGIMEMYMDDLEHNRIEL
jgi:hypothetical protein